MLERVPLLEKDLDSFAEHSGEAAIERIRELARPLEGARVLHVNATAYGGGVADPRDDEAIKLVLGAALAYYHDDPDAMLFLSFAIPQASYLVGGGHYVRGGSQALTDRLAPGES